MSTKTEIKFRKPTTEELVLIFRLSTSHVPRTDFSLAYLYSYYPTKGDFLCHFINTDTVIVSYNNGRPGIKEYALFSSKVDCSEEYKILIDYISSNDDQGSFISSITTEDYMLLRHQPFINSVRLRRDRDNDEYLISTEEHSKYRVKSLSAERRAATNFMKKYSEDIRIFELDLKRHDASSLLLNAYGSWSKIYKNTNNDLDNIQYRYISQMLFHADAINLKNITICHNDQIIGFGLYEQLPQFKTILFHFLKIDYAFDHAFDFAIHVASNIFFASDYTYINIEDDAGIVGIRNKKLNMSPIKLIEKWCYYFEDLQ